MTTKAPAPSRPYDDLERLLNIEADERTKEPERTKERKARTGGAQYRVAAVLVWLGACFTTYLALVALQPSTPWYILAGFGVTLQATVTIIELPMWRRKGFNWLSLLVLAIDVLINAGGVFPAIARIGDTPTARMLQSGGVPSDMGALPAIALALVLGVIIAAAPEVLWQLD